jgi:hypothetical protein
MDEDRRIRFLVAPTLFLASLLLLDLINLGYWVKRVFNGGDSVLNGSNSSSSEIWVKLIAIVAGGGLIVFVGGY